MLILLPLDIVRVVLEEFVVIDVVGLSRLDVAACSRQQRPDLLRLLPLLRPQSPQGVPLEAQGSIDTRACLHWVAVRGVHLPELQVHVMDIEAIASSLALSGLSVPSVTSLHLSCRDSMESAYTPNSTLFLQFMALFPGLRALSLWYWASPAAMHLTCIEQLSLCPQLHLEELYVEVTAPWMDVSRLPPLSSAELLCRLPALRKLKLATEVQDAVLLELAAHLTGLQCLSITCLGIRHASSIHAVCSAHASSLTEVTLAWDKHLLLTDELACSIASTCTNLTLLDIAVDYDPYNPQAHASTIAHIISVCPRIAIIKLWGDGDTEGNLTKLSIAAGRCDAQFYDLPGSVMLEICEALTLPVRKVAFLPSDQDLPAALIRYVGDRFGDSLEVVLDLMDGVLHDKLIDEKAWMYLLQHSPHLREFLMPKNMFTVITDKTLQCLSTSCPLLTAEDFHRRDFSDAAVISFLEHCRCLTSIRFNGCRKLTDAVLVKIADLCPVLSSLDIANTKMTNAMLLELIISKKLRVRTLTTSIEVGGGVEVNWLRDELRRRRVVPAPIVVDGAEWQYLE